MSTCTGYKIDIVSCYLHMFIVGCAKWTHLDGHGEQ